MSAVPSGAKINYTNYQQYAKLYPNAYQNYKPPTGKVKYCESTFFLANTFQQGFLASTKQMVTDLAAQGKADPDLEVQSSNNATATQVSQLQSEVQDGCQVILLQPSSTTAFCPTIQTALQKNVLILSAQPIDCNGAITVSFDVYQNSFELADALFKSMNYKGNVLEVTGVPGVADAATATAAATAAMSGHPDLKVVGSYTGQWTASVAQTATSQWLASHPGVTVDGIIDEGAMGVAAETALQQAGKPLAKVSLQEGDCQELAFKEAHPDLVPFITDQAPAPGAYAMMNVAQRMLAGQQPVLDTISTHSWPDRRHVRPVVHLGHDGQQHLLCFAQAGAAGAGELPSAVLHGRQHGASFPEPPPDPRSSQVVTPSVVRADPHRRATEEPVVSEPRTRGLS